MSTSEMIAALVSVVGALGGGAGLVSYFKERKMNAATAKLTDVQALQQQVALMEQVTEFLRNENSRLIADYNQSEEARRLMRANMVALEDELQKVKRNAAQTQAQCEILSQQLKKFIGDGAGQ